MHQVWLFSLAQCVLSVFVIGVSIRLCTSLEKKSHVRSVSSCLKLCLGWVGAVGGAVGMPVNILLNLRSSQCLYTCVVLVCCPLLIRQFTVWLLLLLTVSTHLQYRLGDRYADVVTRRRMLCLVLLSWLCSVVTAFAQFIVSNSLDTWGTAESGYGEHNQTSSMPPQHEDDSVIGKYLPYGGFLSKFLMEDLQNFSYAEIHSSHWSVCASDIVLSPAFLVYAYDVAVFFIPTLILLAMFMDLVCVIPQQATKSVSKFQETISGWSCSLALSLSLLVVLCLPQHIIHVLRLFAPSSQWPLWASSMASILFQTYSLVPPILSMYSPQNKSRGSEALALGSASSQLKPIFATPFEFCLPAPTPKGKTVGVC